MGLLGWAFILLVIALTAAGFGFRRTAGSTAGVARVVFVITLFVCMTLVILWLLGVRGSLSLA
jgi:uncharacterized membrane protein YtjA (UPF0391 family)